MKPTNCEASDQKITPHKSRAIVSFDPTNNIAKNFFFVAHWQWWGL